MVRGLGFHLWSGGRVPWAERRAGTGTGEGKSRPAQAPSAEEGVEQQGLYEGVSQVECAKVAGSRKLSYPIFLALIQVSL